MVVESAAQLLGVGSEVEVQGVRGVRVGSVGASVELSGEGRVEYVGYVWRSSSSFDEYENVVPAVSGVEEMIVRSSVPGGARVVSRGGGTAVHVELDAGAASGPLLGPNLRKPMLHRPRPCLRLP